MREQKSQQNARLLWVQVPSGNVHGGRGADVGVWDLAVHTAETLHNWDPESVDHVLDGVVEGGAYAAGAGTGDLDISQLNLVHMQIGFCLSAPAAAIPLEDYWWGVNLQQSPWHRY